MRNTSSMAFSISSTSAEIWVTHADRRKPPPEIGRSITKGYRTHQLVYPPSTLTTAPVM